jgi:predicted nucleic-acid-binding Zn-ribbon protein
LGEKGAGPWDATLEQTRERQMQGLNFSCPKCKNTQYEVSEFRATGGFLTKIFDVQTKKFTSVTCTRCKFTEIYKADSSMLGNIFDFFTD